MGINLLMNLLLTFFTSEQGVGVFNCSDGEISFFSNAPLESINAQSREMRGALDTRTRTFIFTVNTSSFQGFNSGLQKEHFNENYLETDKFQTAKFEGKLIENIDLSVPGKFEVRAKGMLEIHGVKQERIIKGRIEVAENRIYVFSKFTVLLDDHNIKIPRVVYQKISPEIEITLNAVLTPYFASK